MKLSNIHFFKTCLSLLPTHWTNTQSPTTQLEHQLWLTESKSMLILECTEIGRFLSQSQIKVYELLFEDLIGKQHTHLHLRFSNMAAVRWKSLWNRNRGRRHWEGEGGTKSARGGEAEQKVKAPDAQRTNFLSIYQWETVKEKSNSKTFGVMLPQTKLVDDCSFRMETKPRYLTFKACDNPSCLFLFSNLATLPTHP